MQYDHGGEDDDAGLHEELNLLYTACGYIGTRFWFPKVIYHFLMFYKSKSRHSYKKESNIQCILFVSFDEDTIARILLLLFYFDCVYVCSKKHSWFYFIVFNGQGCGETKQMHSTISARAKTHSLLNWHFSMMYHQSI